MLGSHLGSQCVCIRNDSASPAGRGVSTNASPRLEAFPMRASQSERRRKLLGMHSILLSFHLTPPASRCLQGQTIIDPLASLPCEESIPLPYIL